MAAWDIWAGTHFIVSEVDAPGADAGLMPRAPAGCHRAAGRAAHAQHGLASQPGRDIGPPDSRCGRHGGRLPSSGKDPL